MTKITFLIVSLLACNAVLCQNVGIGTTTPGFPLNFSNALGDKISLYGNNGDHYGFGIQGGLLQVYSDAPAADISFGYGSSINFTERMRIINAGEYGLSLNGRMILRNGTSPLDLNYGAGIWLYKADNTNALGFMGVQDNQNMGFYGGPRGWGFTYDALNSRVGIGNNTPNAPLSFGATLEKKITLYPGATGDVGFGVAGNRLQIYSDNPNADVAIGYDAAGTFNERFAVKANGALAVYGNTGATGQVLRSNGAGSAAAWSDIGNAVYQFNTTDFQLPMTIPGTQLNVGGLNGQTIGIAATSAVTVFCRMLVLNNDNAFGGNGSVRLIVSLLNGSGSVIATDGVLQTIGNGELQNVYCQLAAGSVPPGTYTLNVTIGKASGDDVATGNYYTVVNGTFNGNMVVQVIPK